MLHRDGLTQARLGQWDAAVFFTLEAAAREAPHDAGLASDVAAVLLERSRQQGHTRDLVRALAVAKRARQAKADLAEAWFNDALGLQRLALVSQATPAWRT